MLKLCHRPEEACGRKVGVEAWLCGGWFDVYRRYHSPKRECKDWSSPLIIVAARPWISHESGNRIDESAKRSHSFRIAKRSRNARLTVARYWGEFDSEIEVPQRFNLCRPLTATGSKPASRHE